MPPEAAYAEIALGRGTQFDPVIVDTCLAIPTEEFMAEDSEGAWIEQIPLHCVIEAYKFNP